MRIDIIEQNKLYYINKFVIYIYNFFINTSYYFSELYYSKREILCCNSHFYTHFIDWFNYFISHTICK